MLNCPFCKIDLGNLEEFPTNCPNCGKSLAASDEGRASVQLISDSAEPSGSQLDKTVESADSSLLPDASPAGQDRQEDPNLSKTFISDEWDDPSISKTVQSDEFGETGADASGGGDRTVQID